MARPWYPRIPPVGTTDDCDPDAVWPRPPSVYESPIEERLGKALAELDRNQFEVTPQAQIGPYRVDFLIEAKGAPKPVRAVIECDGAEFHESAGARAKDAARQSDLLAQGYSVIRFTGSEIHADVSRCVANILHLLHNKVREQW